VEIVLRSTVIFFFLWAMTRALGKRELAEMTVFELLLLVTVGDLVQQGATQEDMSLTGAMLAVSTLAILVLILSYASFRFRRAGRVIDGAPVLVVHDGVVLSKNLHIERVTEDDVRESARSQGFGSLQDIRWGVLEPDGRFSFVAADGVDRPRPSVTNAERLAE
jgi:uncharacterized membrane protein YcaP (DUF421 family)